MSKYIYAHDWESVGKERIPRFPSKIGEKRTIEVSISSWVGISPGAKHYYAKVTEQKNSWWNEDENAWVELSCDSTNGGYKMEADVATEAEAISLAKHFIEIVAGKQRRKHRVVWSGAGHPRWAL